MEETSYFPIQEMRSMYLSGQPIETPYGLVRFLNLTESMMYQQETSVLGMNVLHFYYLYHRAISKMNEPELLQELESFKESSLYQIVMQGVDLEEGKTNQFFDAYFTIFSLVIDDVEKLADILFDEHKFMDFRNIVCDMNMIQETKVSANPEIQKALDDQRKMKQLDKGTTSLDDIVSSIAVKVGYTYKEMNEMTTYQIYMTYYRIAQVVNHDTTTLFATVAEKVDIENWSKHIDMFEEESSGMKSSEFKQKFGGLFS